MYFVKIKLSYKVLFQILTYIGLIFSYSTCTLTLRYLFPSKSNRFIIICYSISLMYGFATLLTNWNLVIQAFEVGRQIKLDDFRGDKWTVISSVVREGGFWSMHITTTITTMLCIWQSWNQNLGILMQRFR